MDRFDKLIKKASRPIQSFGQKDDQKNDDYSDKQTRSNNSEDTSDSQNGKSHEENASTDSKNPQ